MCKRIMILHVVSASVLACAMAAFGYQDVGATNFPDVPGLIELPATNGRAFDSYTAPELNEFLDSPHSELVPLLDRYAADEDVLQRYFAIPVSTTRAAVMRDFYTGWREGLESVRFDSLSLDGRIDYTLFRNQLDYEIRQLDIEKANRQEMAALIPFADVIVQLEENRVNMHTLDAEAAAITLNKLAASISDLKNQVSQSLKSDAEDGPFKVKATVANRAAHNADFLSRILGNWYRFYAEYDPTFTWWNEKPYEAAADALKDYASFIRSRMVKNAPDNQNDMLGDPIGNDALLSELAYEMIPYSPAELIDIANQEFAWCERELLKATDEL